MPVAEPVVKALTQSKFVGVTQECLSFAIHSGS
jgi:hypothetical protein